ncbi:UDP-Gal:beta c beta 1,4- galactosyltransferase, polypeptide 1, gene 1 isoform X1, partial [Pelobates cultripes]
PYTHSTSIGSITWSDHAEISLNIDKPRTAKAWTWRLNPTLLHNPQIRQTIQQELTNYFETNTGSVPSTNTLWAAHKATIRGTIISAASAHRRQTLRELEQHLTSLRTIEAKHKRTPSQSLLDQIKLHQHAIKSYMAKDSQKALQWTKQLYYEKSNKADTLLARRLRHKTLQKHIDEITSPGGRTHKDPDRIASIFVDYFSKLYDHKPNHTFTHPT